MAGFSFSIGDIFAVATFVHDVKTAVEESTGSLPEYERLVVALDNTEKSLAHLALLQVDDEHRPTLQNILDGYQKSFLAFEKKIRSYDNSLGSAKRPSKWWQEFTKKIRWQKCARGDVQRFQSELQVHAHAMHSFVLKMMFVSYQQESHRSQADLETFKHDALLHFASQARHFFTVISLLLCIWTCIQHMVTILNRLHTAVVQLPRRIPNSVPRAITVATAKLQDANGLFHPIYLDLVRSWRCLRIVINDIFMNQPGWLRVKEGRYLLCDAFSTQTFNIALPFSHCFRHGRAVDMNVIFDKEEVPTRTCPRCGVTRSLVSRAAFICKCGFYCGLISELRSPVHALDMLGLDTDWLEDDVSEEDEFQTRMMDGVGEGVLSADLGLPKPQLKKKRKKTKKKPLFLDKPGDFARISIPSPLHTECLCNECRGCQRRLLNELEQSKENMSMVPPIQQSQPMPAIEPSAQMQQPLPQNAWQGSDGIHHVDVLNPANQGIKSHMRVMGTEGDTDPLFKDFRKRSRPTRFFTVGKVFRILWSEPAGDTSTVVSALEDGLTTGFHGEQVFSKVRRFVVVRAGNTYCAALPIVTYARRGVSKPGTNKCDHGIVYTGKTVPDPLPDEAPQEGERPMQPEAIRISPDFPTETLDVASRINYGKVYTIQHNTKAKSFGVVHPRSTESLLKQFQDVWTDSDSPSTMSKKGKQRDLRSASYQGKTTAQAGPSGSSQNGTAQIGTAQRAYANTQLAADPTAPRAQVTYLGQAQFVVTPQVPSRAELHENALQQLIQKSYTKGQALEYIRRYVEWYMEQSYNGNQAIQAAVNELTMPSQGRQTPIAANVQQLD